MCLIARIRVLITTIVLASYSPLAVGHGQPDAGHTGHLAISLFIGRRTRVAASQQFNVANGAIIQSLRHTPGRERTAQSPEAAGPGRP
jgi:hypothetical protein